MNGYEFIKNILLFSMFYSLVMTLLAYSVTIPTEFAPEKGIHDIGLNVETLYSRSVGIIVLDLGALVFFTGNAVLDFLINFVTAVPSAITAVLGFAFSFTNLQADVINTVKNSLFMVAVALYVIALIAIILNVRARGGVM